MFRLLNEKEETEFRHWARQNYTPGTEISEVWHPVVRDECRRMCEENEIRFDADGGENAERSLALED